MAAAVELDTDGLRAVARGVEACADGATRALIDRAAGIAGAGVPGSELSGAVAAAREQLVSRVDRIESALRDWSDAVRVGGEVVAATDRRLGATAVRTTTGRQVAR
jgi:hypothetical protein